MTDMVVDAIRREFPTPPRVRRLIHIWELSATQRDLVLALIAAKKAADDKEVNDAAH
jgi:hypothetical protein